MNLYETYKNTPSYLRNYQFNTYKSEQKKEIFTKMDYREKRELFSSFSLFDFNLFLSIFDISEIKNLYQYFTKDQLISYYNRLPQDAREIFLEDIKKIEQDIADKKQQAYASTDNSVDMIEENSMNIIKARENVALNKQIIKDKKVLLKEVDKNLDHLDKDRKKALVKQLKVSKPSKLDCIGFIAKYRTEKLKQRTAIVKDINNQINKTNMDKNDAIIAKEKASNNMIEEVKNIYNYQDTIESNKANIIEQRKVIRNTEVIIKNLDKAGRKLYGRKLNNSRISNRDLILAQSKVKTSQLLNQSAQVEDPKRTSNIEKPEEPIVDTPKRETSEIVFDQIKKIGTMLDNGISFDMPNLLGNQELINPLNDYVANTNSTVIIITEKVLEELWKKQLLEKKNTETLETGRSRVKTSGYVKLPTLMGLLFLITLISILISKLLIK